MPTVKLSTTELPQSRMLRKRMRLREDIMRLRQRMNSALAQSPRVEREVTDRLRRMIVLREELLERMQIRTPKEH